MFNAITRKELQESNVALEAQVTSLNEEIATLKASLKTANEDRQQLTEKLEEMDSLNTDLLSNNEALKAEAEKARTELATGLKQIEARVAEGTRLEVTQLGIQQGVVDGNKPATEQKGILEQYEAIQDPVQRTEFSKKHDREIRTALANEFLAMSKKR